MNTYIMMTRMNSEAADSPRIPRQVIDRISQECPSVEWLDSYTALGPYDYIDVFRADDVETATKVSVLMMTVGRGHSEVWPVMEWKHFKKLVES